jgi:lipopolysaccharide/colanic/teichoic acid biosynthesis glycosyltransferase
VSGPDPLPPVRPGIPRWFEASVSLLGLVVVSPLIGLAMLAVRMSSPGPIFYRQERMGRAGRPFTLLKLRSMRVDAGGPAVTGRDDARITPAGRWLRKTKLDELPQLWNVVRGDMSLVGPRPEVPRYIDLANPIWRRVLEARPGITDPLTLRLRDEESLMPSAEGERERFYLETLQPIKLRGYLDYLGNRTWWGDIGIVIATVVAVARPGKGADPAEVLRSGRL